MPSQEMTLISQTIPAQITLKANETYTFQEGEVPEFELPKVPTGKTWEVKVIVSVKQI